MISKKYNEQTGNYLAKLARAQTNICVAEKPLTNADHIRAMTDEELAEWLDTITAKAQAYGYECADGCPDEYPLLEDWLPWLKEEAEA